MKFVLKSIPKISGLRLNSPYIWLGVAILFIILLLLSFLFRFTLGQHSRVEEALLTGQRLEVSLITGDVYGKILTTKSGKEAKKEGDKENEEDEKAEKKDEFAWVKEDYIGPRLPEEVIASIIGADIQVGELEMEEVSIGDLSDNPVIVIIIKGLGLSASTTERALELPTDVTLGFSPYSPSIEEWVDRAKKTGHEIVLGVPMETENYNINDPGPYALIKASSKEDNITRLKMLLGLIDGYSAIYSNQKEVFSNSINSVKPILEELKKQRKYYIYGKGYADFSLIQVANGLNYPLLVNDVLLDDDISSKAINQKLRDIEKIAKEKGYVVAMAHPYPITIRMLERWLPDVEEKGLKIVPASFLLGKKIVE